MENIKDPNDIYIVGLGIQNIGHITKEAENVLRSSNHIFYVDAGFGVDDFLKSLCPKVTSMLYTYKVGENRRNAYIEMASRVVNAAFTESPVTFAMYGHPLVFVHPSFLIKESAALLNLKVGVVAGISAFDSVIIDLGIDPGYQGIQMYEASDLLLKDRPLQNDVPCLLWQIDSLETGLFTHRQSMSQRFQGLQKHLLKFYPKDHEMTLVLSSTFPLIKPLMKNFTLNDMPESLSDGNQSGTLYVPPVTKREVKNKDLLKKSYDIKHLEEITTRR